MITVAAEKATERKNSRTTFDFFGYVMEYLNYNGNLFI